MYKCQLKSLCAILGTHFPPNPKLIINSKHNPKPKANPKFNPNPNPKLESNPNLNPSLGTRFPLVCVSFLHERAGILLLLPPTPVTGEANDAEVSIRVKVRVRDRISSILQ
jgi:hypothetical protein